MRLIVNGRQALGKAKTGSIRIKRVRPKGSGTVAAADFAASAGLHKGDRLG